MDFLKKNKPVAIGIGIVLIILVVFLVRGRGGKKEAGEDEQKQTTGRRGRRGRRGSTSSKPATTSKKAAPKKSSRTKKGAKGKKDPKKAAPKINLRLTINDIPQINNKELIVAREKGELIRNYDYTFQYNPYEDWEVRIYLSDTDGDGIPDKEDSDIDDDGYTNEQEIAAGTDPYDYRSHPVVAVEDSKIEKTTEEEKKVEISDEEKRRLSEEKKEEEAKKRWDTIVKNYNYKGTMGMKNSRLAIFKDSTSGDVLLRRINEEIPGTNYKVSGIKNNSVVLLDTESGKEKELFSKTEVKEQKKAIRDAEESTTTKTDDPTAAPADTDATGPGSSQLTPLPIADDQKGK